MRDANLSLVRTQRTRRTVHRKYMKIIPWKCHICSKEFATTKGGLCLVCNEPTCKECFHDLKKQICRDCNDQILKYQSGEQIRVGDTVKIGDCIGRVVFVIPSNEYSEEYSEEDWSYLKEGFGIKAEKYGLVHQLESDEYRRID